MIESEIDLLEIDIIEETETSIVILEIRDPLLEIILTRNERVEGQEVDLGVDHEIVTDLKIGETINHGMNKNKQVEVLQIYRTIIEHKNSGKIESTEVGMRVRLHQ